jgi:hypothetical protein
VWQVLNQRPSRLARGWRYGKKDYHEHCGV